MKVLLLIITVLNLAFARDVKICFKRGVDKLDLAKSLSSMKLYNHDFYQSEVFKYFYDSTQAVGSNNLTEKSVSYYILLKSSFEKIQKVDPDLAKEMSGILNEMRLVGAEGILFNEINLEESEILCVAFAAAKSIGSKKYLLNKQVFGSLNEYGKAIFITNLVLRELSISRKAEESVTNALLLRNVSSFLELIYSSTTISNNELNRILELPSFRKLK